MERRIDPHAPLDYIELQIFPSDNRYEACVSTSNIIEKVASGDLQQLLLHLPQVKDLSSKTSDSNFRILKPDNVSNADWFTIATLTRFFNIVDAPDVLRIGNEISQLEETRKFQLSLFAKAEVDMTSSFESKNELLRAVDLRLSELKEQLAVALNQATGIFCSPQDISNLENFAHHFGAEDIRDLLQKFLELSQFPLAKDSTPEKSVIATQPSQLNPPVKYGVSPAKAAQIERQSSTDESENSFSSEEDQPTVERSRTIARSATPRRLASPMRRVQIGRTGPRRAATISIKSLNYFPNREKLSTQKDATSHASDEEEESEIPAKQSALRMSVQDKISLFENKQKEKSVETEKSKTVSTAPVANKAVLRRWSSGMSESAAQIQNNTVNKTSSPSNPEDGAPGGNAESLTELSPSRSSETSKNIKSSSPKKVKADILNLEMENSDDENEESCEKHPASIEWNQRKEAELNQLFKKMMESKPVRRHSVTNDNSRSKSNAKEQRGGFYDHYKQKRDEKLRKEASGKKAEKESQFKEMEKFLDEKKAEMASTNTSDNRKKTTANKIKPQNSQKNPNHLLNTKKESSKGSTVKKATTTNKPSPLPATRKSWPTTPSPRPVAASPAKTPSGPTSSSASLTRKPQSTSSAVRSSTKVEKSKPQPKTLKSTPPDGNKNIKSVKEKKQPTVTKSAPIAKSKSQTPVGTANGTTNTTASNTTAAKPSFYNKVTKKSSVVPLETKPFLRKGTGIGPGVGTVVVKNKVVAQPEEQPHCTVDMIQTEKNQAVEVETAEIITESQNQETECEPLESYTESETQLLSPIKCEEPETFNHNRFSVSRDDVTKKTEIEEESTISISPTAWVETEEGNQDEIIPCKESPIQASGPASLGVPAGVSSPRVRHSLFQMLLEETTSEADSCEWGNAQHPPAMVNQKDAPKGFKRLLKFARKSKADLNLAEGSSPSSIFRRG